MIKINNIDNEVDDLFKAVEVNPRYARAYYERARIAYEIDRLDGAVSF